MPQTQAIQKISFDELRALLRQGLEELLLFVPDGSEPAIILARTSYESGKEELVPLEKWELNPLSILVDFSTAVRGLRRERSIESVRKILLEENLVQKILAEDESWAQTYLD